MSSELPPSGDLIKQPTEALATFVRWVAELIVAKNWFTLLILVAIANLFLFKPEGGSALKGMLFVLGITSSPAWYSVLFWVVEAGLCVGALAIAVYTIPKAAEHPPVDLPQYKAIKGLRPFTQEDADIFTQLQRQGMLRECLHCVTHSGFRFGILHGVSGCGKTSFLQAGIMPWLSTPDATHQGIYVRLGGQDPVRAIASAMLDALAIPLEYLQIDPDETGFHRLLDAAFKTAGKPLILFLDQFEQFFVYYSREEQRLPFMQALTAWYNDPQPLPVSLVVAVRSDLLYQLDELHKALGYALGPQEVFRLEKFTPTETANVLRAIAHLENLNFDTRFITSLAEAELADRNDGRVSPVDVQILSWMIEQQPQGELRAFDRKAFQKFGGVEGLLQRFLERTLEARILPNQRQTALKVLLALTDLDRQVRAGVLTANDIQTKLKGTLAAEDVAEAVQWLARGDVRLITPQEREGVMGYELAHEQLIPALLRQTQKELTDVERAQQLLDRRVNEWLGNQRDRRYLFNLRELRLVRKQSPCLNWGAKREQKEKLICLSQRRAHSTIAALILLTLLLGLAAGFTGWLRFTPRGQLQGMQWQLVQQLATADSDQVAMAAIAFVKNNQWTKAVNLARIYLQPRGVLPSVSQDAAMSTFVSGAADTLTKSSVDRNTQLQWLQQLVECAQTIQDNRVKLAALLSIAPVSAQLHNQAEAADLLRQALTIAQSIPDDGPKLAALLSIAPVSAQLHNQAEAADLLRQALTIAQSIPDDGSKSKTLSTIAHTSIRLDDEDELAGFLKQILSSAKAIKNDGLKFETLSAIVNSSVHLHDEAKIADFLKQLLTDTQTIKDDGAKFEVLRAIANASVQLHDHVQASDLLKQVFNSASTIRGDWPKSLILSAIATATAQLDDKAKVADFLRQTLTNTQAISDNGAKANAWSVIAAAYTRINDDTKTIELLKQALTRISAIPDSGAKSYVLGAIAAAAVQLDDDTKTVELLKQALINTQAVLDDGPKADALSAIAAAAVQLDDDTKTVELLKQALTNAQAIFNNEAKSKALRVIATASWSLKETQIQQSLLEAVLDVAQAGKHGETIRFIAKLYAKQELWDRALFLLQGYGDITTFSQLLTIQSENLNPGLIAGAVVLEVAVGGNPGNYTLEATIQSPDRDCDNYASWWEVITPDGELVTRQVFNAIHKEQPFTSQLPSVNILPEQEVLIRAHLKGSHGDDSDLNRDRSSYTDQVLWGSIAKGFRSVRLSPDFAGWLKGEKPQPERCKV